MNTTTINGRVRKSLTEQIDRLDRILDGLADGLNGAVAGAVQEAVGLAVRETLHSILVEVARNPDLLDRVRAAFAPQDQAMAVPPHLCGSAAKLVQCVQARATAVWVRARRAPAQVPARVSWLAAQAVALYRRMWQFKGRLLSAVAIGATTAALTYCAGPILASVAAGLGGFAVTAAARTEPWLQWLVHSYRGLDA